MKQLNLFDALNNPVEAMKRASNRQELYDIAARLDRELTPLEIKTFWSRERKIPHGGTLAPGQVFDLSLSPAERRSRPVPLASKSDFISVETSSGESKVLDMTRRSEPDIHGKVTGKGSNTPRTKARTQGKSVVDEAKQIIRRHPEARGLTLAQIREQGLITREQERSLIRRLEKEATEIAAARSAGPPSLQRALSGADDIIDVEARNITGARRLAGAGRASGAPGLGAGTARLGLPARAAGGVSGAGGVAKTAGKLGLRGAVGAVALPALATLTLGELALGPGSRQRAGEAEQAGQAGDVGSFLRQEAESEGLKARLDLRDLSDEAAQGRQFGALRQAVEEEQVLAKNQQALQSIRQASTVGTVGMSTVLGI